MTYLSDDLEIEEKKEQLTPEEEIVVNEATSNLENVKPVSNKNKKEKVKNAGKVKATVSELKKVTWPSFGKVVKQTIVVLSVTLVFLLVVMGIDQLLYLLYDLLTKSL